MLDTQVVFVGAGPSACCSPGNCASAAPRPSYSNGARLPHSTELLCSGRGLLLGPADILAGVPHAPAEHWTLVRPDRHTVWADPSDPPPT
ncbi:hypothetical protein AB0D34_18805 [Streptomyces sp. NPDC048420]|uniref:hypothetical protein n=1 Tax=Streptomyces sp. NPDC048420 TaxID=3155755 RepID=UPI00343C5F5B